MKNLFVLIIAALFALVGCKISNPTPTPNPEPVTETDPVVVDSEPVSDTSNITDTSTNCTVPNSTDQCVLAEAVLMCLQCPNLVEPNAGVLGSNNLLDVSWTQVCQSSWLTPQNGSTKVNPINPTCIAKAKTCKQVEACKNQ
jgi:hypothetical protein